MCRKALVFFSLLAVAALAATAASAHSTPQIRAQKAHARAVMARINRIGRNLETVIEHYDGAKLHLAQVEHQLQRNEVRLRIARRDFRAAQRRIMSRLYSIYVDGRPSTLDVLAGAVSLSQVIDRLESERVLSNQDASIGREALRYQVAVQQRERSLHRERAKRASDVRALAGEKATIENALAEQKRLYASDRTELAKLQQQEAEKEQRLKEEAQRRLAQEEEAAAEERQQQQQSIQNITASGGSTGVGAPPPVVSTPSTGAGHPEAAQIALRYLGVPYVWGGASPAGFDCSGLVMYVYAQLGISLPHYTVAQWNATEPISTSEMQPGDLVFFDNLGHVGIYIGGGEVVDAPHTGAVVRIDSLSSWGSSFVGARRVP
ncbi:MAG TPA: NlpC/P60 family protein [Gaiellaceae bacterium]|nr:NlpC/P60 family protein [Gaiellaceae bacterium]